MTQLSSYDSMYDEKLASLTEANLTNMQTTEASLTDMRTAEANLPSLSDVELEYGRTSPYYKKMIDATRSAKEKEQILKGRTIQKALDMENFTRINARLLDI